MPRFDGTGPQGKGPFTGRGDGYCAVARPGSDRPYGFVGLAGRLFGGFRRMGRGRSLNGLGRGIGRGRGRGRRRW